MGFAQRLRLTLLVDIEDGRTSYVYDAAGRRLRTSLPNGTRTSLVYDDGDRLVNVTHALSDDSVIASFTYTYDKTGHRLGLAEDSGDRVTWTYDDAYQLLTEHRTGTGGFRSTFGYDPAGNRRTHDHSTDGLTTFTYDAANRVRYSEDGAGRTTYTFDAAGNQLAVETPAGDRTTHTWDYEHKLVQTESPAGVVATFTYNGDLLRVSREDELALTRFIHDRRNVVVETDEADVPQAVHTLEPAEYGHLVLRHEPYAGETYAYHFDALGSTRLLTDGSEVVTDEYVFDAWGRLTASSGTTEQPYQWVGRQGYYREELLGRYHVRARDYEPEPARWLSEDPKGLRLGEENLYRYAANDPVNRTDPSGTELFFQGSPDNIHPLVRRLKEFDIDVIYEQLGTFVMLAATHTKGEPQSRLAQLLKRPDLNAFLRRAFEALKERAYQQRVDTLDDGRLRIRCMSLKSQLSDDEIRRAAELLYLAGHTGKAVKLAVRIYDAQVNADFFGCASLDERQRQIRSLQAANRRLQVVIDALTAVETALLCRQSAISGLAELVDEALDSLAQLVSTNPLDLIKGLVEAIKEFIADVRAGNVEDVLEAVAPELSKLVKNWDSSETGEQCKLIARAIPEAVGFVLLGAKAAQLAVLVQQQGVKGALRAVMRAGVTRLKETGERLARTPAQIRKGVQRLREEVKNIGGRARADRARLERAGQADLRNVQVNIQAAGGPGGPTPAPPPPAARRRKKPSARLQGNADWPKPAFPSQVHAELPKYRAGAATRGILEVEGLEHESIKLISGKTGPAESLTQSIPNLSDAAKEAVKHAEGHAAALLKQSGAEQATLSINYFRPELGRFGPCPFCRDGVSELLDPGQRLWVRYQVPGLGGRPDIAIGYFEAGVHGFTVVK